jgi:hypothetical protein
VILGIRGRAGISVTYLPQYVEEGGGGEEVEEKG